MLLPRAFERGFDRLRTSYQVIIAHGEILVGAPYEQIEADCLDMIGEHHARPFRAFRRDVF
ncbi:MAG: hypothetical protein WAJ87_13080 [Bryobacteraceae bacterium]